VAGSARADAPLFVIPIEWHAGATPGAAGLLELEIYVDDADGLAGVLGVTPPASASGPLRYRTGTYPQVVVAGDRSWLESTFVVDHEEADVRQLFDAWRDAAESPPTREGLVKFVAATVKGSYGRPFDVASTVARRREGDCTEYAVLTTALARRAGWPARVAYGVVLVRDPSTPGALGHAWSEILVDGRWVVADAALAGTSQPTDYIPYDVMAVEGPGFAAARMRTATRWIRRIVVVDASSGAPPAGAAH
jgi:hypothetical protein